jgi:hypothetical protein
MKRLVLILTSFALLFSFWGCPEGIQKKRYYDAYFPKEPINLLNINSAFDDYNSALPETHFGTQLIFSSNRRSAGEEFDIIGENLHAVWFWETGELNVDNSHYWQNTDYVSQLLNKIEKNKNQFAPYSIAFDSKINKLINRINLLAYSTNSSEEGYKSEFMYHLAPNNENNGEVFGPYQIPFMGDSHQQYISFYGSEVESINQWDLDQNKFTNMYFDKSGNDNSNIYQISIPENMEFLEFLITDKEYVEENIEVLNSISNERCPFINGNFMVFCSDRTGGFGGFDLYYSYFMEGNWTEPVNFGKEINSENDEFRPITMQVQGFNNDLMVFSSNREGGQGGFDLYYVGINKIIPLD